jgi:hypothetical protein
LNSVINNTKGQRVEALSQHGFLIGFGHNTIIPQTDFAIPLNLDKQYEIHRIRLIVYDFFDTTGNTYLYPNNEQFVLNFKLNCWLGTGTATADRQQQLFTGLQVSIINDITPGIVFKEPFIFKTSVSTYQYLIVNFEDDTSVVQNVTGYPPVNPNSIKVEGLISFEGVSYDIITGDAIASTAQKSIGL